MSLRNGGDIQKEKRKEKKVDQMLIAKTSGTNVCMIRV